MRMIAELINEYGWMDEDSVAPDEATLADAAVFLRLATASHLPSPKISASASGVIFFTWRRASRKATVQFEGDGFFGYAIYEGGGFRAGLADGYLKSDTLPEDLVAYLKKLESA